MRDINPFMFLVRVRDRKKPQVYKVYAFELLRFTYLDRPVRLCRRMPRAWAIKGGKAAIANTVDDAYRLIDQLQRQESKQGLSEVA